MDDYRGLLDPICSYLLNSDSDIEDSYSILMALHCNKGGNHSIVTLFSKRLSNLRLFKRFTQQYTDSTDSRFTYNTDYSIRKNIAYYHCVDVYLGPNNSAYSIMDLECGKMLYQQNNTAIVEYLPLKLVEKDNCRYLYVDFFLHREHLTNIGVEVELNSKSIKVGYLDS